VNGSLQDQRREIYAEATSVLDEDCLVPGAEALFDQALTNGLLVIAGAFIPGHAATEDPPPRRLPSADQLLTDVAKQAGHAGGRTAAVPFGGARRSGSLLLKVAQLRDAVQRTQTARHGRGPGGQVTEADVQALLALDEHPALQAIAGHYLDKTWREAQVDNRIELARAADFLSHLSANEITRRVDEAERANDFGDGDPKPQECPVCGNNTLLGTEADAFGYGTTAGTCLVCSYRRSEETAYDLNLDQEWRTRWQ